MPDDAAEAGRVGQHRRSFRELRGQAGEELDQRRAELAERGVLLATDPKRETLTVRRRFRGREKDVLHISQRWLYGSDPDNPDSEG